NLKREFLVWSGPPRPHIRARRNPKAVESRAVIGCAVRHETIGHIALWHIDGRKNPNRVSCNTYEITSPGPKVKESTSKTCRSANESTVKGVRLRATG